MAIVRVTGRRARRKAVLSAYNTLVFAIGAYFQQAREAKQLDQEDVAERTGMTQTHVSWIETGEWDKSGPERVRAYIRVVGLPNAARIIRVLEALDQVCEELPRAIA